MTFKTEPLSRQNTELNKEKDRINLLTALFNFTYYTYTVLIMKTSHFPKEQTS